MLTQTTGRSEAPRHPTMFARSVPPAPQTAYKGAPASDPLTQQNSAHGRHHDILA